MIRTMAAAQQAGQKARKPEARKLQEQKRAPEQHRHPDEPESAPENRRPTG